MLLATCRDCWVFDPGVETTSLMGGIEKGMLNQVDQEKNDS
jgi:hypothetical protein